MRKLCLAVREATGRFNDTTGMMDLPGWLKMRDLWGWPQLCIRLDCNHAHSYLKINVERWRVHGLTVISIPESFFFPSGHDGTFMGGFDPNEHLKMK